MNTILVYPADWSFENTFDIYGNCYLFIIFIYLFIYLFITPEGST